MKSTLFRLTKGCSTGPRWRGTGMMSPAGPLQIIRGLLGILAGTFFFSTAIQAQNVQATLSQESTSVGHPVQLQIVVEGARTAQVPNELQIDGIDARFAGRSQKMQMQFGSGGYQRSVTSVHTYQVIPLRQGTFTIPAIPVSVDGKRLQTQPLTLRVSDRAAGGIPVRPAIPVNPIPNPGAANVPSLPNAAQPGNTQEESAEGQVAYGKLLVPKETAFAGEVVPVEIRFYFDARYPVRIQDRPGFSGDGFTVLELSKPVEAQQEINGRIYNVISFQTALTPAKSGTLEIPGATLEGEVQMPLSSRPRRDDFFSGLFGQMAETRPMKLATDPVTLDVKPLPAEGRPKSFAGAIGKFALNAKASPEEAAAGDPVSLNVTVSGRGNFDAMGAPELIESDGWRTYPPAEEFVPSPSDPIGFNGEKRFEFMLLAREDQTSTPVAEFSFFDPSVEKYVTLKTSPLAVVAAGGSGAAAPAVAASSSPVSTPEPVSEPTEGPEALREIALPSSFVPLLERKSVLVTSGVLAAIWGLIFILSLGRVLANSPKAREAASLRATRKILKPMEDPSLEAGEFFRAAEKFVRLRLRPPGDVSHVADSRDRLRQAGLSGETESALVAILDRHDAARYSTVPVSLDPDERREILNHLKAFDAELKN